MHNKYNKKTYFRFILLFIILSFSHSETFLRFNYPHAITIKDEKILVIHEEGVTICDPTLKTKLKEEIIFTGDEKIDTEAKLSKITTLYEPQYDDEYIVTLINDYVYIFDNEGNFKLKSENTIHYENSGVSGDYYTLSSSGYKEGYLYYIIGFIYNSKIYLYAYKYDYTNNINTKYYSLLGHNQQASTSSSYYIMNKALTCDYVDHQYLGDTLVCIFLINKPSSSSNNLIAFEYIKVYSNKLELASTSYNKYINYPFNAACFKGKTNTDRDKMVIAGFCNNGLGITVVYDINTYELDAKYIIKHYLRTEYHNLQLKYFKNTDEFIMTGLLTKNDRDGDNIIDNDNVLVEFFNKNLYNYNYAWKYERSCAINGYSILYLVHKSDYYIMSDIHKSDYYIMSDIGCSGTYYPLKLLIGEEPTVLTEAPVESTQVQVEQSTAVVVEDSPSVYVESTQVQVEQSTAVVVEDSPTVYVESTEVQEEPSTTQLVEKSPTLYAESTQIQDDMSTDIGTHEYYNLEKCEIVVMKLVLIKIYA